MPIFIQYPLHHEKAVRVKERRDVPIHRITISPGGFAQKQQTWCVTGTIGMNVMK